jgi:carbon storage regulator CsrA
MLVLTRVAHEGITFQFPDGAKPGETFEIKILGFQGGTKVRIGIEAPKCVQVVRTELLTREDNDAPPTSGT